MACTFFCTRTVFLHDTNSLHGFARFCTVLHFARFCTVLHGLRFLHDMWLNPVPLPLFFSCQAVRRFILENLAVGRRGGAERAPR